MHTSTHAAPLIKHAVIGVGGWHCLCCAPQSGNKYAARAKAQLRRQAKKRERAAFMREQHNLLIADAESVLIEMHMENDAYYDRCKEQDNLDSMKSDMRQRFLERLGEGAVFWDNSAPDVWRLLRVWFDNWDQHGDFWTTYPAATVDIDRSEMQWVITVDDQTTRLPYMEYSLEGVQQYAQLLNRFKETSHA